MANLTDESLLRMGPMGLYKQGFFSLFLLLCLVLLTGCDRESDESREESPEGRPQRLSDFQSPPKVSKDEHNADRNLSPEKLHAKIAAQIKESREKWLKTQEQNEKNILRDNKGIQAQFLRKDSVTTLQNDAPRHGKATEPFKRDINNKTFSKGYQVPDGIMIQENNAPAGSRHKSNELQFLDNKNSRKIDNFSTPVGSGMPSLNKSQMQNDLSKMFSRESTSGIKAQDGRGIAVPVGKSTGNSITDFSTVVTTPPNQHDTLSRRVQAYMASRHLENEMNRKQQEIERASGQPAKAHVVELGAEPALSAETNSPSSAALSGGIIVTGDSELNNPRHVNESKIINPDNIDDQEAQYAAGLSSKDVVARQSSFEHAAIKKREDAIPYLTLEIKENEALAVLAARCLGLMGKSSEPIESTLLQGLGSRDAALRRVCAESLGLLRVRRAAQSILERLKTEKNYHVRSVFCQALGRIGERRALPALKARLDDPSEIEFVKTSAAVALAYLGDFSGRPHLTAALNSSLPTCQVLGLMGMVELGDPDIIGYLNSALSSQFDEVWTTSVFLLARLGPTAVLPVLRNGFASASANLQLRMALAMGYVGSDEGIQTIDRAVKTGSRSERMMGCEVLGILSRRDKIPLLIEALHDPDSKVRQTAAMALTLLNATEAIPALTEAAHGPQNLDNMPLILRGAVPDFKERLVMLACVRNLNGEKGSIEFKTLPGRDQTWSELDQMLTVQQIELVKLYQLVDVLSANNLPVGIILKSPEGRELCFREGEVVAAGFRVGAITAASIGNEKSKIHACVNLVRGDHCVTLIEGRMPDVEQKVRNRE